MDFPMYCKAKPSLHFEAVETALKGEVILQFKGEVTLDKTLNSKWSLTPAISFSYKPNKHYYKR